MTAAPPNEPPASPSESLATSPGISALEGNRAALILLLVQNVVSALLIVLKFPMGTALFVAFTVTTLLAMTLFRNTMERLFADVRWRTRPDWGEAIGFFVLAFVISRLFVVAYTLFDSGATEKLPDFSSQGFDLVILLVSAGMLIPLAEEVAFRGLMMRGHERAVGFTLAALSSSFAFALAHGVPASVVGILPLAYILARTVQFSGSLWTSVIIHALNNLFAVGVGSVLLSQNLPQEDGLTDLIKDAGLRHALGAGLGLLGLVGLVVFHLLVKPKPDPQERSAPGPWLSGAYLVIVIFGLVSVLATLPPVQQWMNQQSLHRVQR